MTVIERHQSSTSFPFQTHEQLPFLTTIFLTNLISITQAENQLPEEPESSVTTGVTNIRVRDPNGTIINRRFFVTDQLKVS